jgi:3-methyladenine DNA glycosylase AlkD
MATSTTTKSKATKTGKKAAKAPAKRAKSATPEARMSLAEVMRALEKAGTAQTKKTYARHGAVDPMYGVSFAVLKTLHKKIGVNHDLALALWDTGNFDARNLAFKVVDPAQVTSKDLDRWSRDMTVRMCAGYVSVLAAETPFGLAKAGEWLASKDEQQRCAGWGLVGQLALRVPTVPDAWLLERVKDIERTLQAAPNDERYAMNNALISLGGRSPALKKAALAAARKIGKVDVDHGDTSCKTPEAVPYIEKMWARAVAKGIATPALQEQQRESPRTRC